MNIPAEFDEIRPYAPEELPQVFEELIADPMFKAVVAGVMPGVVLISNKLTFSPSVMI